MSEQSDKEKKSASSWWKWLMIGVAVLAFILAAVTLIKPQSDAPAEPAPSSSTAQSEPESEPPAADEDAQSAVSIADLTGSVLLLEVFDEADECIGTASGFLVRDNTTLVTNYHVIEGTHHIMASTSNATQNTRVTTVLSYDENADLALLKCEEALDVTPLPLADSDDVQQGDRVYAVGYPLGIANTLSDGIVSSRYIDEYDVDILQITTPVSEGSSGGALLNEKGQVIGVVCASYSDGQNMNLAIASNTVSALLDGSAGPLTLSELFANQPPAPEVPDAETKVEPQPEQTPSQTEQTPCSHVYGAWAVLSDSTCTQAGEQQRKCSVCGDTQTEAIPALDHSWQAATCTQPEQCTRCGAAGAAALSEHSWIQDTSSGHVMICQNCSTPIPVEKLLVVSDTNLTLTDSATITITSPAGNVGLTCEYDPLAMDVFWGSNTALTLFPIQNGTHTIKIYMTDHPEVSRDVTVSVNRDLDSASLFTQSDLQGTWKSTWTNGAYTGYRMYVFSGNSFRWEQRAAGDDAVLQVETGTFAISEDNIIFYPDSYTEDGIALPHRVEVHRGQVTEITRSTLVLSRDCFYKQ